MPPRQREEKKSDFVVKEKMVKYIGTADVRIIYKTDWAQIGIDHDTVKWDRNNNFTVSAEELSEEVLQYCDRSDREMVVVET
jgi:hypothetical protein